MDEEREAREIAERRAKQLRDKVRDLQTELSEAKAETNVEVSSFKRCNNLLLPVTFLQCQRSSKDIPNEI